LREKLDGLRSQFDGKYWPSLQQLLEVVAKENPVAEFMDRSDEAVVHAREWLFRISCVGCSVIFMISG
jgi:hypothetical protein